MRTLTVFLQHGPGVYRNVSIDFAEGKKPRHWKNP